MRLTRLWERVLRVSPIGIHDEFFDLGGDSLLAVRVLAELKIMTGRDLPLATLIEASTIAKMAAILSGFGCAPRWKCLVPIRTAGSRPPFYCVHGVGGSVLELMDLARNMNPDQPFYGLQAMGLSGHAQEENLTVEAMAETYSREIRELQPEGPYYLGGSSFGGLVAYEMARQLRAAGLSVGLVAMFDTSVPGAVSASAVTGKWRTRIDALTYRVNLHICNLKAAEPGQRLPYLFGKIRRFGARAAMKWTRDGVSNSVRKAAQAGQWAANRYVPLDYDGDIALFRATNQPPWITPDRALGWEKVVRGRIQIYDTPGHHADLVRDPRARVLAQQLENALTKAHSPAGYTSPGS